MGIKEVEEKLEERRKAHKIHRIVESFATTVATGCICFLMSQMGPMGITAALAIIVKQSAGILAQYQELKAMQEWQKGVNDED